MTNTAAPLIAEFSVGDRVRDLNGFAGTVTETHPDCVRVCFDDQVRGRLQGRYWHVNASQLERI